MAVVPVGERLDEVLRADADRARNLDATRAACADIAPRLPLCHRTRIEQIRRLRSRRELRRENRDDRFLADRRFLGEDVHAYFFLGAGPFPDRPVALLFRPSAVPRGAFSPFDTGGLRDGWIVRRDAPGLVLDEADARSLVREFSGASADMSGFASRYLGAHFRAPLDYVSRTQEDAPPDFPTFHGLVSRTNDRRAWTIEVRAHDPVGAGPDGAELIEAITGRWDIARELIDSGYERTYYRNVEGEALFDLVARRVQDWLR